MNFHSEQMNHILTCFTLSFKKTTPLARLDSRLIKNCLHESGRGQIHKDGTFVRLGALFARALCVVLHTLKFHGLNLEFQHDFNKGSKDFGFIKQLQYHQCYFIMFWYLFYILLQKKHVPPTKSPTPSPCAQSRGESGLI